EFPAGIGITDNDPMTDSRPEHRFIGINDISIPDTDMKWKDWVHVTKLDPDKQLRPGDIDAIATSGTDALMLSGTLNVTKENLLALRKQIAKYDLPVVMEPAGPEAVLVEGIEYVFVPSVLNTTDVQWIVGKHRFWVQQQDGRIPWDLVIPEAYIVLNPASAVGRVTKAVCDLKPVEVAAYTSVADRYFHFPVVYIEYSGTYGDPAVVKAAAMGKYADTIVVGNAVYDQGVSVLKATVDAVQ